MFSTKVSLAVIRKGQHKWTRFAQSFAAAGAVLGSTYFASSQYNRPELKVSCNDHVEQSVHMINWSGTRQLTTKALYSPESLAELEEVVAWAAAREQKIRPVGNCLSPNGISLDGSGMLSMALLDKILEVNVKDKTITVEGGTTVREILDKLKRYDLTLENFSSITEQQMGGWTQVAAHGTGARIPTVDEMITELTLVTPGQGTLTLREDQTGYNQELFRMARVGLGSLGVVAKMTLRCVPQYQLHEKTYCTTPSDLRKEHRNLLNNYRHVRYMWIPYTDTVVVVVSNVAEPCAQAVPGLPMSERVKPMVDLLRKLKPNFHDVEGKNFAQLREDLLNMDPLNPSHVKRVNEAEAEFWKLSTGERIADSTEILGFECGGRQWVLENCIPTGTLAEPSYADLEYLEEIKTLIEKHQIPAASPIEQRWTARSTSPLSPAFSSNSDDIFSWVGVIMYVTNENRAEDIKRKFKEYASMHADLTMRYKGVFHWAKVDLDFHSGTRRLSELKQHYAERFDTKSFQKIRGKLDPSNILSNSLVDTIFAEV